ncbi:WD40 repeat domain-containing protein [Synechococcus elongatus]|uniref:WD40 repeat domain-containing protein n=1 Tax=Synechococcus elongatus TaxID=32046 RepID=UPI001ABF94F2
MLISLKGTPHTKMNIEREQIEAIAFSPDNTTLATATAQIIKVIDSKTGQLLHLWDGGGDVQFTPDGRTLVGFIKPAAENAQASLRAWDVKSGKILQTIPLKRSDIDRPFSIFDISSKGDSLIVAPDYGNRIEQWDLNTGKLQQTWASDQQGQITTLALTPDDQTMILAQNNSLLFLSLSSGKIIKKANAYSVLNLMVDQREDQLLSENRSELMLWQLKTGDRLAQWRLSGTLGIASKPVVFSPDGQLLATYTHEGPIKLWQLKSESSSRGQR